MKTGLLLVSLKKDTDVELAVKQLESVGFLVKNVMPILGVVVGEIDDQDLLKTCSCIEHVQEDQVVKLIRPVKG